VPIGSASGRPALGLIALRSVAPLGASHGVGGNRDRLPSDRKHCQGAFAPCLLPALEYRESRKVRMRAQRRVARYGSGSRAGGPWTVSRVRGRALQVLSHGNACALRI